MKVLWLTSSENTIYDNIPDGTWAIAKLEKNGANLNTSIYKNGILLKPTRKHIVG